jgi:hypothetical protein
LTLFVKRLKSKNLNMADELRSERATTMMTPSELRAVDDWSFQNRVRSRGKAVRRLIELGLDAAGQQTPEKTAS